LSLKSPPNLSQDKEENNPPDKFLGEIFYPVKDPFDPVRR